MEPKNDEKLKNWFTYHSPEPNDISRYKEIRDGALEFARIIDGNCPDSADKTAAFRKVREAVMTANASIACGGK